MDWLCIKFTHASCHHTQTIVDGIHGTPALYRPKWFYFVLHRGAPSESIFTLDPYIVIRENGTENAVIAYLKLERPSRCLSCWPLACVTVALSLQTSRYLSGGVGHVLYVGSPHQWRGWIVEGVRVWKGKG